MTTQTEAIESLLAEYDMINSAFAKDLREALAEHHRKAMQDAVVGGTGITKGGERIDPASIYAEQQAPDYAWPTIADYEKEVGFKVNEAFRAAWTMARTTNDLFKQMGSDT